MSFKQFIQDTFNYIFVSILILLSLLTIFYIFNVNFNPPKNNKIIYQKEIVFPLA